MSDFSIYTVLAVWTSPISETSLFILGTDERQQGWREPSTVYVLTICIYTVYKYYKYHIYLRFFPQPELAACIITGTNHALHVEIDRATVHLSSISLPRASACSMHAPTRGYTG